MGIRTNIYGIDEDNLKTCLGKDADGCTQLEFTHAGYACLGKMTAYVDVYNVPKMNTIQWLGEHLTDKEDREYLAQYYDLGYCGEYITFNQIFKHDEMLDFIENYYNDKARYSPFKSMYGIKDVILLLENYDYFLIEWTGG